MTLLADYKADPKYVSPEACDLCARPDVGGQKSGGTLNGEDFADFCHTCDMVKSKEEATIAAAKQEIKETNEKIAKGEITQSPSSCELCQRSDVQGALAGDLYNTDFAVFCHSCKKLENAPDKKEAQEAEKAEKTKPTNLAAKPMTLLADYKADPKYVSPEACDLCARPDVGGQKSGGTLNGEDFADFCHTR